MVTICSPRPMRAVQRARFVGPSPATASQAPLAANRPDRQVVQPDAVLEVSDGVLDLGVAAMVSLQLERLLIPVGDEAVVAVAGEQGQLGTGRGLHTPGTMSRTGAAPASLSKGV